MLVCWTPWRGPGTHSSPPPTLTWPHFYRFKLIFIWKIYHGIIPVVALSIFVKLEYLRFLSTLTTTGTEPQVCPRLSVPDSRLLSCLLTVHLATRPPGPSEADSDTSSSRPSPPPRSPSDSLCLVNVSLLVEVTDSVWERCRRDVRRDKIPQTVRDCW